MRKILLDRNPHLDALRVGCRHMKPGQSTRMSIHHHDCSEIAVILHGGAAVHWVQGQPCPLNRGDVLLMHPGTSHMYGDPDNLELVNLLYEADRLPLPPLDGGEMKLFRAFCDPQWRAPHPEEPLVRLSEADLDRLGPLLALLEEEIGAADLGQHLCVFGLFVAVLVLLARAGGIPLIT